MGHTATPLPQWTWEALETALDQFGTAGRAHPVRDHLMRGLRAEAATASPEDLLRTVLCTALVVSQIGGSDTVLRPEERSFG